MCTNQKWLYNKYTKQRVLVKCGKCASCLQDKADRRMFRIRNHYRPTDLCLFVTLTYSNEYVPYIRYDELPYRDIEGYESWRYDADRIYDHLDYVPIENTTEINVYRDGKVRSYKDRFIRTHERDLLDTFIVDRALIGSTHGLVPLQNQSDTNKIGVLYYPDVQNFIKKLRQNLKRVYGFQDPISYFSVGEYGPTTLRPHFHLLLFVPKEMYPCIKAAICKAWPFADYSRTFRNIEIAKEASSYVSSYVNRSSNFPSFFRQKCFDQKHTSSKGFGYSLRSFSLAKVLEKLRDGVTEYDAMVYRDGSYIVDSLPYPQYLINRYFPKVKGYSRLTSAQIQSVYSSPQRLSCYARKLDYIYTEDKKDLDANKRLINRTWYDYYRPLGISRLDFAYYVHLFHQTRFNNMMEKQYQQTNYEFSYDNIQYAVDNPSTAPTLPVVTYTVTDPNKFPQNKQKTLRSFERYHQKQKQKKLNNFMYNLINDQL